MHCGPYVDHIVLVVAYHGTPGCSALHRCIIWSYSIHGRVIRRTWSVVLPCKVPRELRCAYQWHELMGQAKRLSTRGAQCVHPRAFQRM